MHVEGATAIRFEVPHCYIMADMDDVERVAWIYLFWTALQMCQQACP